MGSFASAEAVSDAGALLPAGWLGAEGAVLLLASLGDLGAVFPLTPPCV